MTPPTADNAKHTPGKMIVDRGNLQIGTTIVAGAELPGPTSVGASADVRSYEDAKAVRDANARRLAACWNACEGISTDALEKFGNIYAALAAQPQKLGNDDGPEWFGVAARGSGG